MVEARKDPTQFNSRKVKDGINFLISQFEGIHKLQSEFNDEAKQNLINAIIRAEIFRKRVYDKLETKRKYNEKYIKDYLNKNSLTYINDHHREICQDYIEWLTLKRNELWLYGPPIGSPFNPKKIPTYNIRIPGINVSLPIPLSQLIFYLLGIVTGIYTTLFLIR